MGFPLVFVKVISLLSRAIACRAEYSRLNCCTLPMINRRWTRFLLGPGSLHLNDQTAWPLFRFSLVTDPYCMTFSFLASVSEIQLLMPVCSHFTALCFPARRVSG